MLYPKTSCPDRFYAHSDTNNSFNTQLRNAAVLMVFSFIANFVEEP